MPVILMLGSLLLSCVFSCMFKELSQTFMYKRCSILGTKNFTSFTGFWLCNHIVQDTVQRNKACFRQWRCCLCLRKILIRKLQEVVGLLCHQQFKCLNRSSSEIEIAVLSIYDLKLSVSESFSEFSGRRCW